MKRVLLCFYFAIFALMSVFAQGKGGQLVIFSEQGEPFQVVLNGLLQYQDFKTNARMKDLTNEYYVCKIMFEDHSIPDLDLNYLPTPYDTEVTYKIKKNDKKGRYELKYVGERPLSGSSPDPYVDPAPIVTNPQPTPTNPSNPTNPTNPIPGIKIDINIPDPFNNPRPRPNTNPRTETNPAQPVIVYVPGYSGPVGCPTPMDAGSFYAAKGSIDSKTFEDTKIQVAKQVVGANCVTASQVKDLLGLFTYESSKLDMAKYCYSKTYDIGNYYLVNDAFTYSSSVDELNTFIQRNPVKPLYNAGQPVTTPRNQAIVSPQQPAPSPMGKCGYATSDTDFEGMKTSIKGQSFDDSKLKVAKQIAASACLRATQIKEIVTLFSFENRKVEFAKFAYAYCYDPQNYHLIYDAFSIKSSTDEVSKHVMGR